MGMRITENTPDSPINVRIPAKLKNRVDELADGMGISTAAFVRMALEEKVERIETCADARSMNPEDLRGIIKEIVDEMLAEKEKR